MSEVYLAVDKSSGSPCYVGSANNVEEFVKLVGHFFDIPTTEEVLAGYYMIPKSSLERYLTHINSVLSNSVLSTQKAPEPVIERPRPAVVRARRPNESPIHRVVSMETSLWAGNRDEVYVVIEKKYKRGDMPNYGDVDREAQQYKAVHPDPVCPQMVAEYFVQLPSVWRVTAWRKGSCVREIWTDYSK
jgi:hypothetical protein